MSLKVRAYRKDFRCAKIFIAISPEREKGVVCRKLREMGFADYEPWEGAFDEWTEKMVRECDFYLVEPYYDTDKLPFYEVARSNMNYRCKSVIVRLSDIVEAVEHNDKFDGYITFPVDLEFIKSRTVYVLGNKIVEDAIDSMGFTVSKQNPNQIDPPADASIWLEGSFEITNVIGDRRNILRSYMIHGSMLELEAAEFVKLLSGHNSAIVNLDGSINLGRGRVYESIDALAKDVYEDNERRVHQAIASLCGCADKML